MVTVELNSIGIMDEDLILELPMKVSIGIHLNPLDRLCGLGEVSIEAGPEVNQEALQKTIKRKWVEDMGFRRRLIYRARYESNPSYTEEAGFQAMTPSQVCARPCIDRRAV